MIEMIDTAPKQEAKKAAITIMVDSDTYNVTLEFDKDICKSSYDYVLALLDTSKRLVEELRIVHTARQVQHKAIRQAQEANAINRMINPGNH